MLLSLDVSCNVVLHAQQNAVTFRVDVTIPKLANVKVPRDLPERTTLFFCLMNEATVDSFGLSLCGDAVTFTKFVLDRMHMPTDSVITGRTQAILAPLCVDCDGAELSADVGPRWRSEFVVRVPEIMRRSWFIAACFATSVLNHLMVQDVLPRQGANRDVMGKLHLQRLPLRKTKFDDEERQLQIALRSLSKTAVQTVPFVELAPYRISSSTERSKSTEPTSESAYCTDSIQYPLSTSGLVSTERFVALHFFLFSSRQVEELAGHFYRFLVATNGASSRRFCNLKAARLTIPLILSSGLRSAEVNATISFLRDAHAIASLHAVHQHERQAQKARSQSALYTSQRLHDSPTKQLRASLSRENATHMSTPSDRSKMHEFKTLPPELLLEAISNLCSRQAPSSSAPPVVTTSTSSVYKPWVITWFDFVLLTCADDSLWQRMLLPLLHRWNRYSGDWTDAHAHIHFMVTGSLDQRGESFKLVSELLADKTRCLFDSLRGVPLSGGQALFAVLPIGFQRLVLEPYDIDFADRTINIPLLTTKFAAAKQILSLTNCARVGDNAGAMLCLSYFFKWLKMQKEAKEQRRRNQLIKSALDRKFSTGNLKSRYYKKWLAWLKARKMRRDVGRRKMVTLPQLL